MALIKPRCSGACYLGHRMRGVDPRKACGSVAPDSFFSSLRWIRGARCGAARSLVTRQPWTVPNLPRCTARATDSHHIAYSPVNLVSVSLT